MSHTFNINKFFEDLNARIDKPIDYNHLIATFGAYIVELVADVGLVQVDGVLYFIDTLRGKTISVNKNTISAGGYGQTINNRYLKVSEVPTQGQQGVRMMRDGVITGISAKSRSTDDWEVEIRKNGVALTLAQLPVTAGGSHDDLVDIDFNEGDFIQVYADGQGIQYPIVTVEYGWRLP